MSLAARGLGSAALVACLLLAACAGAPEPPLTVVPPPPEPPLGTALPAGHTGYDNRSLARLFGQLTHGTEWGGTRPWLVRYEEPVIIGLEGEGAAQYAPFLERFTGYLRRHGGVPIGLGRQGQNLWVRFVEGPEFRRILPAAACVLVPGNRSWDAFAADPARWGGDALLRTDRITAMTVFLPRSAPPHAVRACLIEEISQALGPVNDLYGLGPSIFNDDFAHVWPTRLDLLMLRVLYSEAMETGLSRPETEARAEGVLDAANPAGRRAPPLPEPIPRGSAGWRARAGEVLRRDLSPIEAEARARAALDYAAELLPGRPEHCHAALTLGRVLARQAPEAALAALSDARAVCARAHGAEDVRLDWIALERASALEETGAPDAALSLTDGLAERFAAHGLDARLAGTYALRVRAFSALGRAAEATRAERSARRWAGYALGRENGGFADWLRAGP
ncbi:MAG: DUF2927 domain-containing protein [Paracoccaceae bacterium]